jgi:CxxC-x17-CxxC domain-containing protein
MEGEGRGSDRPMFDAVCSKCGQPCKVPFKPSDGRPVYCRNCYKPKSRF